MSAFGSGTPGVWEMNLQPEPFAAIKCGEKTVEMRLYDERRQRIRVGDKILFTNTENGEVMATRVKFLERFSDFEALYRAFDKSALGYRRDESASPQDMQKYYDNEKITEYGTLAIGIEVIDE